MPSANPRTPRMSPSTLKRNRNPWFSIPALVLPYVGITLIIAVTEWTNQWAVRLAVLPIIAAFQNHLQILQHEGAHFQIHPKRKWNDLLTDVFCSVPFLGLVRHYRHFHFLHHRHLLDPHRDPEVEFYSEQNYYFEKMKPFERLKILFRDVSGFHYFQFFISYNRYLYREIRAGSMAGISQTEWTAIALVMGIILSGLIYVPHPILPLFYWFAPQPTFLFFFLKLQGYGEHSKRGSTIEDCTHTYDLGWFTRFFIYPLNSDLHLEHHLYPSVPWYRLRAIHEARRLGQ